MSAAFSSNARANQEKIVDLLKKVAVIPVITIDRLEDAVPLAEALIAGGINHLEITLRSPVALQGAQEIIKKVPGAIVGIGTALTPDDFKKSADIGAQFILSPGATPKLLEAAAQSSLPFIPGVATASEIMTAQEFGFFIMKFFPASTSGGKDALKGFYGPFANILFCPTGGISYENFMEWRALPNVITVGGSWLTPKDMIRSGNWSGITKLAKDATSATQQ